MNLSIVCQPTQIMFNFDLYLTKNHQYILMQSLDFISYLKSKCNLCLSKRAYKNSLLLIFQYAN